MSASTMVARFPVGLELADTRIGVNRGIGSGVFQAVDVFVPQVRALGAGVIRAYVYWARIEPEAGLYDWSTVDALLGQLTGEEEVWLTVCSASLWATQKPTDFLPSSPAHDLGQYEEFVRRLVRHCAGRVRFWHCDNEPSNTQITWAGTAAEYVVQLKALYRAVKDVDPSASVVLGGCGYDVLSSEEGSAARQFFDYLASEGRDAFDLFDVHLYGDVDKIPEYIETARQFMRAHGYMKPVVVGEFGGPMLFEYPEHDPILHKAYAGALAEAPETQSTQDLQAKERAEQDTPEQRAIGTLYEEMDELPPTLQMFLMDCPAAQEALRHRINARQIVQRTLLAMSQGVQRVLYWNLGPEVPEYRKVDRRSMMYLLIGKLPLMDYVGGELGHRHPAAEAFALLTGQMSGVKQVTRITIPNLPTVYAFEVRRAGRPPVFVLWNGGDKAAGEGASSVSVTLSWAGPTVCAFDDLGRPRTAELRSNEVHLEVSINPVYVTAESGGTDA